MKMKKFISAIAAVAMLATSVVSVSAAVETFHDGDALIVLSVPTPAEVKARTPKLDVKVEELKTWNEVRNAGASKGYANGVKDSANKDAEGGRTVYKVTLTYSNLGELVNGLNEDWNATKYVGVSYSALKIATDKLDPDAAYMASGQFAGGITTSKYDAGTGLYLLEARPSDVSNPYPAYDASAEGDAMYQENGTFSWSVMFDFEAGTTFEIPGSALTVDFSYNVTTDEGQEMIVVDVQKPESIKFGEDKPLDDIIVTPVADAENKITLGKAWDVNFKYDTAKAYTATFTNLDEADEAKKTLVRELDFSGVAEWENGSRYSFVTLLRTTKANVELAIN